MTKLFEKRGPFIVMDRTNPHVFDGKCELCGADGEELRPYGPNNENICFDCGMKDEETTAKRLSEMLDNQS